MAAPLLRPLAAALDALLRILTLTSLFPGLAAPRHGLFVKERMADFRALSGAEVKVVSPVPFFPRLLPSARYGHFARAPRREEWAGFDIQHPRYLMIPRVGAALQGLSYYLGVRGAVRRLRREFPFDLIDAHYAYPDGFAAALLKHRLEVPLVLTVRGTDVNLLPGLKATAAQVRYALKSADALVAVSRALAGLAIEAGADPARMTVLRNGVDAERFRPLPMAECRRSLGLPQGGRVLVSVGFLVPRKGHSLLLRALALIPAAERPFTVIAGDGPEEGALRSLAADLGLAEQVRLLGAVEHDALAAVYSSADLSVLASSREGWPNVLLESMACGTPVVATAVHGSPEVVADESVGLLVEEQSAEALAGALQAALARGFDRERVRRYALGMSWRETSAGLERVFQEVLRRGPNGRRGAP